MTGTRPPLVGARVARVEDRRYTTGAGRYLDDLEPAGTLHLRLVRSPVASGRITSVELSSWDPPPEGTLLFTGADLDPDLGIRADIDTPTAQPCLQPALARDVVRFSGEPVAAVLHPDQYAAEDAAECVDVDFDSLEAIVTIEQALAPDAPLVHDGWRDNAYVRRRRSFGDLSAARARAARTVRLVLRTNRQAGVPLENRGCLAVPDERGRGVTLWTSTQIPHLVRTYVAAQLGLAENDLRVVAPDVGGGFGVKGHVFVEEVLVPWLALRTGRPVKWVEDRREHLLASIHARDHLHVVEAYVGGDGHVEGLRAQLVVDAGAYSVFPWTSGSDSGMAAKVLLGPYDIQDYEVEDIAVATHKCPLGTYRGVGRPSAVFTMERLMDEVARQLDLDPFAVRRRNIVREFPYRTATGPVLDSGSYAQSLDAVEEALAEELKDPRRGSGDRPIGVGLSLYNEQTAHGTPDFTVRGVPIETGYESVALSVDPQGTVTLATGMQSHGQSMETTLAQVVAGELGVPLEHVRVDHGDTAGTPYTVGTWGSRGAVLGGGAAARAARRVREKLLGIAAHNLDVQAADLDIADGVVHVVADPARRLEVRDIAYWANRRTDRLPPGVEPGLAATVFLDGPERGTYSNACHGAVVEVDRATGKVRIQRYVVVEDCGVMINPTVVEGQIYGGVAQGIGSALLEEFVYGDDGQPLSSTFMDYLMPSSADVPLIEVRHLESPSPWTEYGMKGMGEAGAIGPMAAIANAVADALGVPVHETPLRMQRVWELATGSARRWAHDDWADLPGLSGFWTTGEQNERP